MRLSTSQSRAAYDSHRKQPSLHSSGGYLANLGASGYISNSAQKSTSRFQADRYML